MEPTHHFLELPDIKIPYYTWEIPQPRSTLVFVHGLKSHSGWFLETGSEFAERGIKVYAFDRRGSGVSESPRGDIQDYHFWIEDIHSMVQLALQENPEKPVHLLGHCFGAKLSLAFVIANPDQIKSLIMIAPPQFSLKIDLKFMEKLRVVLTLISGKVFNVLVPVPDEAFTKNIEKNIFIKNDSLRLQKMTTRLCREILKIDRWINKRLAQIYLPTLILLASKDELVDNSKIEKKLFAKIGSRKKVLEVFDCYHHLFFEPHGKKVIERIAAWIEAN